MPAKLRASWTSPWFEAPSPIITIATSDSPRSFAASAIPTAWSACVPTGEELLKIRCAAPP